MSDLQLVFGFVGIYSVVVLTSLWTLMIETPPEKF